MALWAAMIGSLVLTTLVLEVPFIVTISVEKQSKN